MKIRDVYVRECNVQLVHDSARSVITSYRHEGIIIIHKQGKASGPNTCNGEQDKPYSPKTGAGCASVEATNHHRTVPAEIGTRRHEQHRLPGSNPISHAGQVPSLLLSYVRSGLITALVRTVGLRSMSCQHGALLLVLVRESDLTGMVLT